MAWNQITIDGHLSGEAETACVEFGSRADGQHGPCATRVAWWLDLLRQFRLVGAEQFEPRQHLLNSQIHIAPQQGLRDAASIGFQQGDFVLNHLLVIQSGLIDGLEVSAHFGRHLFQVGLQLSGILQNQISVTCDLQVFFDLING